MLSSVLIWSTGENLTIFDGHGCMSMQVNEERSTDVGARVPNRDEACREDMHEPRPWISPEAGPDDEALRLSERRGSEPQPTQ